VPCCGMAKLTLLAFPGKPRWIPEKRAVALAWMRGPERGEVVVPASVLSLLAGPSFEERQAIAAVHLNRAQLESAAGARIARRRTKVGGNVTIDGRDIERIVLRTMT